MVAWVQFSQCLRVRGLRPGCHVTTLFETDAVPAISIAAPAAPKKHGWLPLLTVLFLLSYGLMTMLIVEQGRTIDSQRALIRELFRDSTELSAVKQKAAQDSAQASSAKTQAPVTQNPSTQYPSTQAPTSQAPSSQAGPQQQRTQSQSAKQKPDFKMPSKPAADLVDDVRTLITI
jgi:cell division septation protein DedD